MFIVCTHIFVVVHFKDIKRLFFLTQLARTFKISMHRQDQNNNSLLEYRSRTNSIYCTAGEKQKSTMTIVGLLFIFLPKKRFQKFCRFITLFSGKTMIMQIRCCVRQIARVLKVNGNFTGLISNKMVYAKLFQSGIPKV